MILTGYVRRLDQAVTLAQVLAPDLIDAGDPDTLAAQCLAGADPTLAARLREGDVLVLPALVLPSDVSAAVQQHAEAAVFALQAAGCAAMIVGAVAGWFATLAIAHGLAVLVQPDAAAALHEGGVVRLDLERGTIRSNDVQWHAAPLTADQCATVRRYQLLVRMRRVVDDEDYAG